MPPPGVTYGCAYMPCGLDSILPSKDKVSRCRPGAAAFANVTVASCCWSSVMTLLTGVPSSRTRLRVWFSELKTIVAVASRNSRVTDSCPLTVMAVVSGTSEIE